MTIFGANWRTTVSGIGTAIFSALTALAALPYTLGEAATIIPPDYKAKVFTVSLFATVALRVWNSVAQKDKSVTGGTVQQTVNFTPVEPGHQNLVDETVKATVASGERVSPEQAEAVYAAKKPNKP